MNIEHFRRKLLERQKELTGSTNRLTEEARQSGIAEVEDPIDQVTSAEAKAADFEEAGIESEELEEVNDALRRIEDGTYGKCIDCGRSIEPDRLEAVPWTPYCFDDQRKHDQASAESGGDLRL
jgi:DnaK suppressor protein